MNTGTIDLELHFSDSNEVSVKLISSINNKDDKFCEILLFLSFAIRNMVNFGMKNDATLLVIDRLERIWKRIDQYDIIYRFNGQINDYKGVDGKHKFIACLDIKGDVLKFHYKAKGFGLLGRDLISVAPDSVDVLARYLKMRREDDNDFARNLRKAARLCAREARMQSLTISNQSQKALFICNEANSD